MHKSIPAIFFLFFFAASFSQTMDRLPCVDKKFNVVAHIFLDSAGNAGVTEAQITQAFEASNGDFAPICISFEVCEFVYHPNFEYDKHNSDEEWEELQALYHQPNRINVFYVKKIEVPDNVCGYAGLGQISNTASNGIVIQKTPNCCGQRTHSHELGHYFNLEHTFQGGGSELADGSNCETEGDGICDTPADPYVHPSPVENYVDENCRFIYMVQDANGDYYDPITGNIMSYYPDACNCGFTHGQLKKMALHYLNNTGMW
jgi:hypothetical protein